MSMPTQEDLLNWHSAGTIGVAELRRWQPMVGAFWSQIRDLEAELRGMCPGCLRHERYASESIHESACAAVGRSMCLLPVSARRALGRLEEVDRG